MAKKQKTSSDLQGIARLVTEATIGITDLVEAMHKRIVHPPFLPSTPIQHAITNIAGVAYTTVRQSTKFVGTAADKALGQFVSIFGEMKATDKKQTVRAVLNGVVGDYLEKTENPLQITMQFRYKGKALSLTTDSLQDVFPALNGKIILMVHGSCMSDIQWTRNEHNHGLALAATFDKTPVFLNYNSGLHISTNGQTFSDLIEDLVQVWPVPVEELVIIGHSMGGLVTRSALHYGKQQKRTWTKHLKKIVFLGTPHHGAPMEKAGNYVDVVLEAVPYAKPFARLGKIRSAGVTDLRYGNLLDEDWHGTDRFKMQGDTRHHVPLPNKIACYSIAATGSKETQPASSKLKGDTMVSVKSALGKHKDPEKVLKFKQKNTWIAHESSHLDLLSNVAVYEKIKSWIS